MLNSTVNNLEYYKVFFYVARTGSLTLAAKELSISQPAVSQSVRQLERQLGVALFCRTGKGVRLSPEGELLYSYVAKGYEQILLGEEKLRQMLNLELGEIKIGASDMTLQFYLLPFLEKFHEKYPHIKVIVTNAPTPETFSYLKSGKIDFGVVSTPFDTAPEIQAVAVKEIQDTFIAGLRFLPYKNKTLDFQDLKELPLICLEGNTSTRCYVDAFLQKSGVHIQPEFELATSDMIVQFALRNLGIGCVMSEFAKEYLEAGKLFELRFNKILPKRHFCIVKGTRNPLAPAAANLLNMIYDELGDNYD